MNSKVYKGETFLGYANEAAAKIRNIHKVISGGNAIPEYGSLLGDVYYCIAEMIGEYLEPIFGEGAGSDKFNDMITEIMFAEKDKIVNILMRYYSIPT